MQMNIQEEYRHVKTDQQQNAKVQRQVGAKDKIQDRTEDSVAAGGGHTAADDRHRAKMQQHAVRSTTVGTTTHMKSRQVPPRCSKRARGQGVAAV
jgi:hypothetical protein